MVVGDRILVNHRLAEERVRNCVGTVVYVNDQPSIDQGSLLIEFDWWFSGGHDGNGTHGAPQGLWGRCWWLVPAFVKKIGTYNPRSHIQIGQRLIYATQPMWGPGTVTNLNLDTDDGQVALYVKFDERFEVGILSSNDIWLRDGDCELLGREIPSPTSLSPWNVDTSRRNHESFDRNQIEEAEGIMPVTRSAHRNIHDHWVSAGSPGATTGPDQKFTCGICRRKKYLVNQYTLNGPQLTRLIAWDKHNGGKGEIEKVCNDCIQRFFLCNHCKKYFLARKGTYGATRRDPVTPYQLRGRHGTVPVCPGCFQKFKDEGILSKCAMCRSYIYPGSEREDDHGNYLCFSCYSATTRDSGWDNQLGRSGYKSFLGPCKGIGSYPKRRFGIEIEALCKSETKRVNIKQMRPWVRYSDGSLSSGGEEFASPIFLGESGFAEVDRLLKLLNENKYKVDSSCAVHCHIEAKDFNLRDMKRFLIFMWDYEAIVYSCLRDPCRGGLVRFCRHVSREKLVKAKNWKEVKEAVYGHKGPFEATSKWSGVRYRGLNIHSFFFRNTIECRYLGATIDPEEVANFIQLCLYSIEYGRAYPQRLIKKPIKPTLKDMNRLLGLPVSVYTYLKKCQISYDKKRGKKRKEEER